MKKEWYLLVKLALRGQVPDVPFARACVLYERHCGTRRPDRDNLVSGFKWIQDGLVLAGLLEDDREENIYAYHGWHPASKKDKRVTVSIVPILTPTDPP